MAIGVLMNTRGLTEVVVLSVGRQLGVISPVMFTLMVIMALLTTLMAMPVLRVVYPERHRQAARTG
jgi:Kef-type K+ transport system membrane component KefB